MKILNQSIEPFKESLLPAINELERARDFFGPRLFGNLLNDVVITIQTKGRKAALGWFGAARWKNTKTQPLHEVNISAEHLKGDPIETLLHEFVHAYNHAHKIKDWSGHQYHNKHFREEAERIGLIVKYDDRVGYGLTVLGEDLKKVIELEFKLQVSAFDVFRRETSAKKKAPTKMKKWVCSCGIIVRCAVELNARCEDCNGQFIKEEGGE